MRATAVGWLQSPPCGVHGKASRRAVAGKHPACAIGAMGGRGQAYDEEPRSIEISKTGDRASMVDFRGKRFALFTCHLGAMGPEAGHISQDSIFIAAESWPTTLVLSVAEIQSNGEVSQTLAVFGAQFRSGHGMEVHTDRFVPAGDDKPRAQPLPEKRPRERQSR